MHGLCCHPWHFFGICHPSQASHHWQKIAGTSPYLPWQQCWASLCDPFPIPPTFWDLFLELLPWPFDVAHTFVSSEPYSGCWPWALTRQGLVPLSFPMLFFWSLLLSDPMPWKRCRSGLRGALAVDHSCHCWQDFPTTVVTVMVPSLATEVAIPVWGVIHPSPTQHSTPWSVLHNPGA